MLVAVNQKNKLIVRGWMNPAEINNNDWMTCISTAFWGPLYICRKNHVKHYLTQNP